jgi:hypothetical protein
MTVPRLVVEGSCITQLSKCTLVEGYLSIKYRLRGLTQVALSLLMDLVNLGRYRRKNSFKFGFESIIGLGG